MGGLAHVSHVRPNTGGTLCIQPNGMPFVLSCLQPAHNKHALRRQSYLLLWLCVPSCVLYLLVSFTNPDSSTAMAALGRSGTSLHSAEGCLIKWLHRIN